MEHATNVSVLNLQGFAPLIQLWAGICLLFLYESLLKVSPFSALCNDVKSLYVNFVARYNGFVSEYAISPDEFVKDMWSNNYLPTIKSVASLCFFYSAFILAFIGIEENQSYGGGHYCALQVMNTIVCIYILLAVIFYKWRIFHGLTSSVVLSISLLAYFHFHFQINEACLPYFCFGEYWSRSDITVYTVFTCISGVMAVCARLILSWMVLQGQKVSIYFMDKKFRRFADYNLGRIRRDGLPKRELRRINKRCNDRFNKGEISAITTEAFNEAMAIEVRGEYNDFTSKWWIKLY